MEATHFPTRKHSEKVLLLRKLLKGVFWENERNSRKMMIHNPGKRTQTKHRDKGNSQEDGKWTDILVTSETIQTRPQGSPGGRCVCVGHGIDKLPILFKDIENSIMKDSAEMVLQKTCEELEMLPL